MSLYKTGFFLSFKSQFKFHLKETFLYSLKFSCASHKSLSTYLFTYLLLLFFTTHHNLSHCVYIVYLLVSASNQQGMNSMRAEILSVLFMLCLQYTEEHSLVKLEIWKRFLLNPRKDTEMSRL